jgi:hypothetical protein
MCLYPIALIAVVHYLVESHTTGPVIYLLAVLPALPIIGSIVVVGLYIAEEKDEFQRRIMEWSLLWAIGATLATTTVWGFLEMFAHVRHITPFWVFPLFWVSTAVAGIGLRIHYRGCNE